MTKATFILVLQLFTVHALYAQSMSKDFLLTHKIREVVGYRLDSLNSNRIAVRHKINERGLVISTVQFDWELNESDTLLLTLFQYDSLERRISSTHYVDGRIFSNNYLYIDSSTTKTVSNHDGKIRESIEKTHFRNGRKIMGVYENNKLSYEWIQTKRGNTITWKRVNGDNHFVSKTIEVRDAEGLRLSLKEFFPKDMNCKSAYTQTVYTYDSNKAIVRECITYSECLSNQDHCITFGYFPEL